MSIDSFAGIVTGMLFGSALLVLGMLVRRKRGEVQEDERTTLIKGRAAVIALWGTGAFLFIAWVVDNLLTYRRGGEIRFFTPWSMMLAVLLAVFVGTYLYFYQRNSADETDEAAIAKKRRIALTNLAIGLSMLPLTRGATATADTGLRYMLLCLGALVIGISAYTLLRHRHQTKSNA